MNNFLFCPIYNKTPKGACVVKTKVGYDLFVQKDVKIKQIFMVVTNETSNESKFYQMATISQKNDFEQYYANVEYSQAGHYWYYFKVISENETYFLQKTENFEVEKTYDVKHSFLQLVYAKENKTDSDIKNGIMYHIFVDRFNKVGQVVARTGLELRNDWAGKVVREVLGSGEVINQQCFGGNLNGVIDKLDYLKKLNVKVIYLSPIFEANSNHKYDTANFAKIDSMFGDEKVLKELIDKANDNGIKIILDGVFNHTGSDSVYFNKNNRYNVVGAYNSKKSVYYNWYKFKDYPDDYFCWWGVKTLPETNDNEPSFVEYISGTGGIVEKYMRLGLYGYRLDVVDELSDDFSYDICAAARRVNPQALVVGEVWEDAAIKVAYDTRKKYFLGNRLNSVTNYPLKNAIIDFVKNGNTQNIVKTTYSILDHYPKEVQDNLMNILGTHDTARILSVLGANNDLKTHYDEHKDYDLNEQELKTGVRLLKMASLMQYTFMGIPCVYYGDEAGLQGLKDPYCRACFDWNNINQDINDWYKLLGKLRLKKALSGV